MRTWYNVAMSDFFFKKYALSDRRGTQILELLFILAILTVSIFPLAFIFKSLPFIKQETQKEVLATMLAHHIIETILAKKTQENNYLPFMSEPAPPVEIKGSVTPVSEYFRTHNGDYLIKKEDTQLYEAFKHYNCKVDTYYLDESLYRIIVYVAYNEGERPVTIYLERLLTAPDYYRHDEGP